MIWLFAYALCAVAYIGATLQHLPGNTRKLMASNLVAQWSLFAGVVGQGVLWPIMVPVVLYVRGRVSRSTKRQDELQRLVEMSPHELGKLDRNEPQLVPVHPAPPPGQRCFQCDDEIAKEKVVDAAFLCMTLLRLDELGADKYGDGWLCSSCADVVANAMPGDSMGITCSDPRGQTRDKPS